MEENKDKLTVIVYHRDWGFGWRTYVADLGWGPGRFHINYDGITWANVANFAYTHTQILFRTCSTHTSTNYPYPSYIGIAQQTRRNISHKHFGLSIEVDIITKTFEHYSEIPRPYITRIMREIYQLCISS